MNFRQGGVTFRSRDIELSRLATAKVELPSVRCRVVTNIRKIYAVRTQEQQPTSKVNKLKRKNSRLSTFRLLKLLLLQFKTLACLQPPGQTRALGTWKDKIALFRDKLELLPYILLSFAIFTSVSIGWRIFTINFCRLYSWPVHEVNEIYNGVSFESRSARC